MIDSFTSSTGQGVTHIRYLTTVAYSYQLFIAIMGLCDKCKRLCPSTKMRQGDDPLCDECKTKRIATLACEQQQRKLRSSMRAVGGETSTMDTKSTQAVAAAEPPRDGQPPDVVTTHSETSPASRIEAAHSETPPLQSPDIHCLEHCRHGQSGDGDMIRCCMCFRWLHEQCVSGAMVQANLMMWNLLQMSVNTRKNPFRPGAGFHIGKNSCVPMDYLEFLLGIRSRRPVIPYQLK